MRIEIEIPKEFEEHFNQDKFEDSLNRLYADVHLLAGKYERELAEMLIKAFRESKPAYSVEKAQEDYVSIKFRERLFDINKMDLDIPQHFTKEQAEWIKKYCIHRNKEFYNKAIDDFVEKIIDCIDGDFMYQFKHFPAITMREMAECCKLKFNA